MGGGGPQGGVSHPFLQASSAIPRTHPHAFICLFIHQGGCARGGHPGFDCQGCCGACSPPLSGLLQPSVRRLEDLGVVASGHRPVSSQPLRGRFALPDGDFPVCPSVCSSGGLDGLHRPSGSLPPDSCPSGVSSLPSLCGPRPGVPVQSAVLRPVHSPAGLHSGYGSCFRYPPFSRYPYAPLSGRLARPVLLEGGSSPWPRRRLVPLPELGIVVNPEKSNFAPSQIVQYLGVVIDARSFSASPSPDRISRLLSTAEEFLCSTALPASFWQSLLGMLSSLSHLVPGGRLRMRSLQLCLHRSWDRVDPSAPVSWTRECFLDLRWWLQVDRLTRGVSLRQVRPDLDFWSDASDIGWGAHLGTLVVSGLWDEADSLLPANARELLAVRRGLLHFRSYLSGATVAVFCDNVTTVAYLRKEGGTRSPFLNDLAQEILRWAESLNIRLAPQFIPGIHNVLADSLSRPHQLPSSEWSLNMEVFRSLQRQWPVMIDLFATSDNRRCSLSFSPFCDPLSAGTDALLQSWDGLQAYAFPPWSILPQVLAKLRAS